MISPFAISFFILFGIINVGILDYILIISGLDILFMDNYRISFRQIYLNLVAILQHLFILCVFVYEKFESGTTWTYNNTFFLIATFSLLSQTMGSTLGSMPKDDSTKIRYPTLDHVALCVIILEQALPFIIL